MVEIKGTTIIMTKGDTAIIHVKIINQDGTEYIPQEGDRIRFAMKKNYTDCDPIMVKDIPIATMELIIDPADTKMLDAGRTAGMYKYDIELTKANGNVDTFIPRADILILEEVL